MSSLIQNATIKIRQDSASNWTSTNPTPLQGEWCLETDTGNIKIGDGSTAWTGLEYYGSTPIGSMMPYAGATAPTGGWMICDGSAISRTTYASLFTAISTTWGVGDGSTTFNIPDMREVAPVGVGTSDETLIAHDIYTLGEFKDDAFQGHYHDIKGWYGSGVPDNKISSVDNVSTENDSNAGVYNPITDGTNGTPRTGTITRGKRIGVNYIIKY